MTVYVQRDGGGNIVGVYATLQPGYAEELLDDSNAEVQAYLNPSAAALLAARRAGAKALAAAVDELGDALRAVLLVLVDEINNLRARNRAQDTAVANAGSLAALKTNWAALNPMPDRTAAQAKTAILNKIDSGDAD